VCTVKKAGMLVSDTVAANETLASLAPPDTGPVADAEKPMVEPGEDVSGFNAMGAD
jgi:hypothetical protein